MDTNLCRADHSEWRVLALINSQWHPNLTAAVIIQDCDNESRLSHSFVIKTIINQHPVSTHSGCFHLLTEDVTKRNLSKNDNNKIIRNVPKSYYLMKRFGSIPVRVTSLNMPFHIPWKDGQATGIASTTPKCSSKQRLTNDHTWPFPCDAFAMAPLRCTSWRSRSRCTDYTRVLVSRNLRRILCSTYQRLLHTNGRRSMWLRI